MNFTMRYGDRPNRIYPDSLGRIEKMGGFVAQFKMDGWNTTVVKDSDRSYFPADWHGSFAFLSRRGIKKGGPTAFPVSREIIEFVQNLQIPDKSVVNVEWMKRRTIGECPERMYAFDALWWGGEWQGKKPYSERLELLKSFLGHADNNIMLPEQAESGFEDFFERSKQFPYTEGIVIKRLSSKLMGNRQESVKNPNMMKCKWRDGASGREVV